MYDDLAVQGLVYRASIRDFQEPAALVGLQGTLQFDASVDVIDEPGI